MSTSNKKRLAKAKGDLITIGLCGQVSAGKTSFLNAICGGFIGSVSLARETIQPELIQLRVNADQNFGLYEKEMLDIKKRNTSISLNKITEHISNDINIRQPDKPLPSLLKRDIDIIDFPGVNDSYDKNGEFINVVFANLEKVDILIYITSAETAFTLASELTLFKKIKAKVDELNNKGNAINLIIVINKVDDPHDVDYQKVTNNISKEITQKNSLFRISSHKIFVHYLKTSKIKRSFTPELFNELSKILKNANTVINNNIKKNIKEGKSINFETIGYNDDIFDDEEDSGNSGDWNDLTKFIYDFNNYNDKKKSMQDYANKLGRSSSVHDLANIIERMMNYLDSSDFNIIREGVMEYYLINKDSSNPNNFILIFNKLGKQIQNELLADIFHNDWGTFLAKSGYKLNMIQIILFFENMEFFKDVKYYSCIIKWIRDTILWRENILYEFEIVKSSDYKIQKLPIKLEYKQITINGNKFNPFLSKFYDTFPDFQGLLKLSTLNYKELHILKYTNHEKLKKLMKPFDNLYKSLKLRLKYVEFYTHDVGKPTQAISYYILTDITEQYSFDI